MLYGLISELIFFALALTRVRGTLYVALATMDVIAPVMVEMNVSRVEGGITGVISSFDLLFPSAGVVIIAGAIMQTSRSTKLELVLINCRFGSIDLAISCYSKK